MTPKPSISVILPVRNEARSLPALLWSLIRQDFPAADFEIIVADGRSTDETRDVVQRLAAQSPVTLKLVDNPGIRSGPGRNAGLHVAAGEFILFIDGHCHVPSRHLLRDTQVLFEQTQADCLCRPQPLIAHPDFPFGASIAAVRASALGHGRDSLIYDLTAIGFVDPASSGAAYRRSVFATLGDYDERFDACEDVEFNTRVRKNGMKAYTDPKLAVFYEPRANLASLLKQMMRYGRGRVRLMTKHRDCISAGQLAPAFLVAAIAIGVVALMPHLRQGPWVRIALSAPAILYCALVLLSSVGLARKSGLKFLYQAPAIYFAIHVGLGIGIWEEMLRGVRTAIASQPNEHKTVMAPLGSPSDKAL